MGNPVVHFEIFGSDGEQLRAFYKDLFGWKLFVAPGGGYAMVDTESHDQSGGVRGGIGTEPETDQRVLVYIQVPDIDAHLAKVTAAGGSLVRGRTEFGPVTTALARDPAGNVFGLAEEAAPQPH